MADAQTVNWVGASGRKYTYWIYPRHPEIAAVPGNYIYTKIVNNQWVPIYIGQGDLSVRLTKDHHQIKCINSKGATHVHVHSHKDPNEAERLAEEKDLLAGYPNAYAPSGCNIKEGG